MRVLVVYAHYNPESFCHAVLEQVTKGLGDAGHSYEVVDLYAIGFDPVFGIQDSYRFIDRSTPRELLEEADLKNRVAGSAGGPIRRFLAKRFVRDKDLYEIADLIGTRKPKDVAEQQAKVAAADGLIFIAPVFWMRLPAILSGWIDRVFSYGFAYSMTPEGWDGHVSGRIPLMKHRKALIITTTFFRQDNYREGGWQPAMDKILVDWGLKMPGVERAEHVYFHAPLAVGDEVRRDYLAKAYKLGREFEPHAAAPEHRAA